MIIEDKRDVNASIKDAKTTPPTNVKMVLNDDIRFQQFLAPNLQIKYKEAHLSLMNALIDHI